MHRLHRVLSGAFKFESIPKGHEITSPDVNLDLLQDDPD